jgi:DNA replication and repair protein RecF
MRYATRSRRRADAAPDRRRAPRARARSLERALAETRAHDVERGITHSGRTGTTCDLALGGRDLRVYGSAGPAADRGDRAPSARGRTLRDHAGSEPVFLLDDPFAELDARRAHRILDLLRDAGLGQTILVVPRASDIPEELTRLARTTIRDGTFGS